MGHRAYALKMSWGTGLRQTGREGGREGRREGGADFTFVRADNISTAHPGRGRPPFGNHSRFASFSWLVQKTVRW